MTPYASLGGRSSACSGALGPPRSHIPAAQPQDHAVVLARGLGSSHLSTVGSRSPPTKSPLDDTQPSSAVPESTAAHETAGEVGMPHVRPHAPAHTMLATADGQAYGSLRTRSTPRAEWYGEATPSDPVADDVAPVAPRPPSFSAEGAELLGAALGTAPGSVDCLPVRLRPRWKDQHRAQAVPGGVPSRRPVAREGDDVRRTGRPRLRDRRALPDR
jgi:hypothetical protein